MEAELDVDAQGRPLKQPLRPLQLGQWGLFQEGESRAAMARGRPPLSGPSRPQGRQGMNRAQQEGKRQGAWGAQ